MGIEINIEIRGKRHKFNFSRRRKHETKTYSLDSYKVTKTGEYLKVSF